MMEAHSEGLDLNDDKPFQERFWTFQRFAWLAFALCVILALAGLTGGGGPLSRATASGDAGTVDYPRVARWEASDALRIILPESANRQVRIDIGSAFSEVFELEDIQPQPSASEATAEGLRFVFDLSDPPGERRIVMHVRAMRPSLGRAMHIRINGGPALAFAPVVLP